MHLVRGRPSGIVARRKDMAISERAEPAHSVIRFLGGGERSNGV